MADAPTTVSVLSGFFKERYAKKLEDAKPKGLHFKNDIMFAPRQAQPGNTYHQPVALTHEHGFTYAAAGSGAFSLNDAEPGVTKDGQVVGTQMLLKSQIDYETAARASGGPRAFARAFDHVVENMSTSTDKRCELDIVYGTKGIGRVKTAVATTRVITIQTTEWAVGIWAGQENAFLEFADTTASSATVRSAGTCKVRAIDSSARTVTLVATGQTTTQFNTITDGDHIYFLGQHDSSGNHNVSVGLHGLGLATGTVLNIDSSAYSLWQATRYDLGGSAMSFSHVNKALARAAGKGCDDDINLYVNNVAWANMLQDEVAQRRHLEGGGRYKVGANGIEFYSQTGTVTIKASRYVKEGYAYAISPKYWMRVGATDKTFNLPDRGDEFFRHLDDKAGYELRAYVNHALFTKALAKMIIFKGIVNT